MKKNAIVGQSGGPTAVINASLYGVVYEVLNREDVIGTIYGMINGIEGFLNENMMDMKPLEANGELELIKTTPGSYLGSCRYKRSSLRNLRSTISVTSSTSVEMIPWIQ